MIYFDNNATTATAPKFLRAFVMIYFDNTATTPIAPKFLRAFRTKS